MFCASETVRTSIFVKRWRLYFIHLSLYVMNVTKNLLEFDRCLGGGVITPFTLRSLRLDVIGSHNKCFQIEPNHKRIRFKFKKILEVTVLYKTKLSIGCKLKLFGYISNQPAYIYMHIYIWYDIYMWLLCLKIWPLPTF